MIEFKNLFLLTLFYLYIVMPEFGVASAVTNPIEKEETTWNGITNEPTSLKVWEISFTGNKSYSNLVLEAVIAHKAVPVLTKSVAVKSDIEGFDFSEIELKKDVIRLQRFYKRRGFPNVAVSYNVREGDTWWKRSITFIIKENTPIKINKVTYSVNPAKYDSLIHSDREIQRQIQRIPFKVNRRYEPVRTEEIQGIFVKELKRLGFPFAEVSIQADTDSVSQLTNLTINLIPYSLAYIDSIQIVGDLSVSKKYVLKEAGLYNGMLYNQSKLAEAQQELINHQLFRFVTVNIPKQEIDSTVSIVIRLQEHPLRTIMVRGGVGTEELIRGELAWGHLNPFGNAHQIGTRLRSALNSEGDFRMARIMFDYTVPYLYNTRSGFRTSPFVEFRNEFSYNLGRFGINNAFLYQHSLALQSIVSYEYTVNRIGEKTTRSINRDSLRLYNISSIKLASFFRQTFIDRKPGWYVNPNIEISGVAGLGTYRYDKYFLDLRRYLALSPSSQIALKTHIGFMNVRKTDDIPAADRFYAGGTSSVRGWLLEDLGPKRVRLTEDGGFDRYVPVGGKAMLALTAEIRKQFSFWKIKGLGVATFLDGGQVWRGMADIDLMRLWEFSMDVLPGNQHNGLQYGAGGGLSYDTPIGPIRIDIAYKLNPTEADLAYFEGNYYGGPLKRWAIHLSIGHPF